MWEDKPSAAVTEHTPHRRVAGNSLGARRGYGSSVCRTQERRSPLARGCCNTGTEPEATGMPEGAVERKKNLRSERPGLVGWPYPSRPRDEGALISRPRLFI